MVLELAGLYGATLPLERFDVENLPSMWGDHFHVFLTRGFGEYSWYSTRKNRVIYYVAPPVMFVGL